MRSDLPTGTVTFLFTDVEGSTRLLGDLGAEAYAGALAEHRRVIRAACAAEGGVEVDTQGDAFFFAFPTAPSALAAASALMDALATGQIRVRAGVHTGTPLVTDEGYVGTDVHRAARIAAAGHGGQVLVAASTASLVDAGLVDLGEHRFKDLSAPERLYQLSNGSFPPLKTLYRTNLPVPQTPFLGREKELSEVLALLARQDVRLLTLTGPGGTGKTRLAAQSAGALAGKYPDGVFWVPLAPIREPELVLEAAAKAVGSPDGFASHVRDRKLLLLLDNFEQVIDAATDVSAVLGECPNVEVLVTSRELLHLGGEHEYAVPPFAEEEGVGFFAARARALRPDFEADEAAREICRRLDGLPLALELAAARLRALSTAGILERLEQRLPLLTGGARDAPERQRTLRATIEWSHELLTTDEQVLFARLSVFSGGCTLEAAEAVCGADLDTLQPLVEKSLVRFTDERYWMLETIREYASEQLESSGDANVIEVRHAAWYRDLSEESEPQLMGPSGARWIVRLDSEIANMRKAVAWGMANDRELALAIVANTGYFWPQTGRAAEGRRLVEAGWMDDVPASLKIRAVRALSGAALAQNDLETVERLSRERLELARELGDPTHEGAAMGMLANALADRGETEAAREWYEAAIAFDREHSRTSPSLGNLGRMERDVGNLARSRELLDENLAESTAAGNEVDVAWVKKELAGTATEQGAFAEACAYLIEGFEMCKRLGLAQTEGDHVFHTAMLASRVSRPEAAAVLLGAVAAESERDGFEILPTTVWWWTLREGLVAQLGEEELERFMGEGRSLDHEQAVVRARLLLDEVTASLRA